jgi:succinyl-CoA synthetase beta subunit
MADTPAQAGELAGKMLGNQLITIQTGAAGRPVNSVLVVEKMGIKSEFYFAILMDRVTNGPMVIASSEGGMDIEGVARDFPDSIYKQAIDINVGMTEEQAKVIAANIGFPEATVAEAAGEMLKLYNLFISQDATMVEINPMSLASDDSVVCMDAKFNFDDNAEYRQKPVFELRDFTQENPLEVTAAKSDLNYIGLDGEIGCLVNGAGLAMATMDIINLNGGEPANFLDVGGGATVEQVESAFRLITSDPKVNCILVNIFGGIMRCDVIADGVIQATRKLTDCPPVVLRLQGTKVNEAKAMVAASGLDIISADELDLAARKAVLISQIANLAKTEDLNVSFKNKFTVGDDHEEDGHGMTAH